MYAYKIKEIMMQVKKIKIEAAEILMLKTVKT